MKKSKKANILTENLIFLILNLVFLAILIAFLFLKMGDVAPMEEKYAKQIALMVGVARPGMELVMDMEVPKSEWYKSNFQSSVFFNDNIVTVKLSEKGGYSYSFFNNVNVASEVGSDGKLRMLIRAK